MTFPETMIIYREKFELGSVHDECLSKGFIPVSLIRWEMTGEDDELRQFLP